MVEEAATSKIRAYLSAGKESESANFDIAVTHIAVKERCTRHSWIYGSNSSGHEREGNGEADVRSRTMISIWILRLVVVGRSRFR